MTVIPMPPERSSPSNSFQSWVTVLVHRYRAQLTRVVRREGVRAGDALDCVQEAFLTFLGLPQARLLVDRSNDSARMLTILARNIARNRRRRPDYVRVRDLSDGLVQSLHSDDLPADEIVAMAEQHAAILGCMTTMNEVQRGVVQLRLVDELTGEDVAAQLGTTKDHVAVLLFRAKQHLRRCVEVPGEVLPSKQGSSATRGGGSRKGFRDPHGPLALKAHRQSARTGVHRP